MVEETTAAGPLLAHEAEPRATAPSMVQGHLALALETATDSCWEAF